MDSSTVQKLIFAGIWIWIGIISFWKMMKIWLRIQFQFRNHNTSILHLLAWDKSYVQKGLTWNTTSNMNEAGSPTTVRMRPRLSSIQRINRFFRAPESAILATVDQAVENRTNMTSRCIVLYRLYRFAVHGNKQQHGPWRHHRADLCLIPQLGYDLSQNQNGMSSRFQAKPQDQRYQESWS